VKLLRLAIPVICAISLLLAVLFVPVLLSASTNPQVERVAQYVNPLLVAYTYAQTAPQTIAEMSTEVDTFATTVMPAWTLYVVFVLIAAIVVWLISRFIRSMKH
jgi:disulfide bond formation protein DsbB